MSDNKQDRSALLEMVIAIMIIGIMGVVAMNNNNASKVEYNKKLTTYVNTNEDVLLTLNNTDMETLKIEIEDYFKNECYKNADKIMICKINRQKKYQNDYEISNIEFIKSSDKWLVYANNKEVASNKYDDFILNINYVILVLNNKFQKKKNLEESWE